LGPAMTFGYRAANHIAKNKAALKPDRRKVLA